MAVITAPTDHWNPDHRDHSPRQNWSAHHDSDSRSPAVPLIHQNATTGHLHVGGAAMLGEAQVLSPKTRRISTLAKSFFRQINHRTRIPNSFPPCPNIQFETRDECGYPAHERTVHNYGHGPAR